MNDDTHSVLAQMTLAIGRLDTLMSNLQEQTKNAQAQMQATREKEEAKFKQAMVTQFQDQQQRLEAALRPRVAWAWKIIAALAGFSVLLLVGYWLLLRQADARLRAAQARAETIEVKAEVLEAFKHVDITSCGGRPCIRIDRDTPTWKSKGSEYILVDAQPGKETRKRP
ncbi:hypothetical protein [Xanthomonas fragariae]|uniref:hypothetical protein n=1 Tax=Xanthomonas fragariae TaxID=48664 RepID=UPI001ABDC108|nr:hypothetical protein [Xanthomonas fragariae]UKR51497.1 hypothetical protein K4A87_11705 [Xanthomonas fragariae]